MEQGPPPESTESPPPSNSVSAKEVECVIWCLSLILKVC